MADLETRIATWVDDQTAGVAPVTLDEIHHRASALSLEPAASHHRRLDPRVAVAAAILLVMALVGAALLLDNDQDQPVVTEPTQPLNRLAALMPDDMPGLAELTDLEPVRERTGIDRPAPGSSIEDGAAYIDTILRTDPSAILLPSDIRRTLARFDTIEDAVSTFRSDMGLELEQITAWAEWGFADTRGVIFIGTFDEAAVEAAARSNEWPGDMTVHEHRGVTYYAWLDEYTVNVAEASLTNPLGQTRRIALVDDVFILTTTTANMEAAIDRALDGGSAGAPDGARAVLAALLDATRSAPPEAATVWAVDDDAVTYLAAATTGATERPGPYAMTFGIGERVSDDMIADETERLLDLLAADPAGPEPGPFPELIRQMLAEPVKHSIDGRVVTVARVR
jgi:hypothetical protein